MAKDREGSVNIYGAMQAKTAQGIVAYTDGIAHEKEDGTVINLDEMLKNGVGGGSAIVDVDKLVYPGWSGTTVPNSGIVENVYFNTELSIDEVKNLLIGLNYIEGVMPFPANPLIFNGSSAFIVVGKADSDTYMIHDAGSDTSIFVTTTGWNPDFNGVIEVNSEVLSEFEGLSIGSQNSQLSSLISTTPFVKGEEPKDDVFYRVAKQGGVVVPNTGYVEKVYLNTSLTDEEIEKICSGITLTLEGAQEAIVSNSDVTKSIGILNAEFIGFGLGYVIASLDNSTFYYFSPKNEGVNEAPFYGWNPDFNGVVEINSEVVSEAEGISIGTQNNLLIDLFSLTPNFGKSKSLLYTYKNGEYKKVLQEGDNSSSSENVGKEIVDLGTISTTNIDEITQITDKIITITEEQYNKLDSKNVIAKLMVSAVDGSQFIKKEVYFEYAGNFHINITSENKEILYVSISGGDANTFEGNTSSARGTFIETIVAQTDGTNYWLTYDVVKLVSNPTNEVSTTNGAVVTSSGVATALQSYAKTTEVNQMIADYITTNFENFDEGEF